MDVFLTKDLETWIRERVDTGTYTSEGHLVRRALRMLREHDERETLDTPEREVMPPLREVPRVQAVVAK